jgi:membrane fusion protein (multidrug efflux system)
MPVVLVESRRQPVVEALSLVGTLAANEEVEVKAETDGIVQEVLFQEGQAIQAGDLLIRLDETKLQAEMADAEARLKLFESTFERAKQLHRDQLVSQQEFDQAASAFEASRANVELRRRLLKDARLAAPFSGRTGARSISPGQVITRNTVITWLVDLDPMKVEMNVPERFLGQIQLGQRIQFDVTAYAGRRFEGEIYFIAPRLDLATRTALVKTRIPNADGVLKAGMVANLELALKLRDNAIVIPEVALLSNGDQTFVFVVGADHIVQIRPVVAGQRMARWIEITSGLEPGEKVVAEGHQKIGSGMEVVPSSPEKAAIYEMPGLPRGSSNQVPPIVRG